MVVFSQKLSAEENTSYYVVNCHGVPLLSFVARKREFQFRPSFDVEIHPRFCSIRNSKHTSGCSFGLPGLPDEDDIEWRNRREALAAVKFKEI